MYSLGRWSRAVHNDVTDQSILESWICRATRDATAVASFLEKERCDRNRNLKVMSFGSITVYCKMAGYTTVCRYPQEFDEMVSAGSLVMSLNVFFPNEQHLFHMKSMSQTCCSLGKD